MQETQETWVQSLGWEDPLEKEMATHSSIVAENSHGQRSLAGYSPTCGKVLDMTEWLSTYTHSKSVHKSKITNPDSSNFFKNCESQKPPMINKEDFVKQTNKKDNFITHYK